MIRLLIVDKLRSMCDMMEKILRNEWDLEVVGVATSVPEALTCIDDCDVVLVSSALPHDQALEMVRLAAARYPAMRVLVMDVASAPGAADLYLQAGAAGCVFEEDSIADLLTAVRAGSRRTHPARPQ